MTDKKQRHQESLGTERNSLFKGNISTETIDLNGLFPREITESGSFGLHCEIWNTTFGKVLQALPIPILLVDASCCVLAVNQACRKFGEGYETMTGKPFSGIFANPSDALKSESMVETVFSSRKTSIWEAPLKMDDDYMWGRLTFRSIRMREQRLLLILVEDLTPEKKQNLLNRKYNQELKGKVKERTEELRKLNLELLDEIAERKRSEDALRRTEERFSGVAESLGDWIWEVDPDGLYRYCSSAVKKILGFSPDELVGKKYVHDLLAPQMRDRLSVEISAAFRSKEEIRNLVAVAVHKNGETVTLETGALPILDETGLLKGYRGVHKDITERKRVEEERNRAQEFLRILVDNLPIAVFAKSAQDYRFILWNKASETLLGVSKDQAIGKTDHDFFPKEQAEFFLKKDREGLASGNIMEIREEPILSKSLGSRILRTRKVPLYDEEGNPYCILGISDDITDRKKMEEALRESEQKYRSLFEDAPLMYVITRNREGIPIVADCNQLFLRSVGYAREEVIGKPLADFYSSESAAELLENGGYQRSLAGEYLMGERHLVARNGRLIPTLLRNAVELDASGVVVGTRAMFVDITERKRVELALRESEERFKAVFNSHHAVMLIIDPETSVIMDASPGACAFYGYTLEQITEKTMSDINTLSPEEIAERLRLAKSHQQRYFDFRHRLAGGEIRDVEVCSGPIIIGGKEFLFSIINDVTERRQSEEACLISERKYRSLFDESRDGLYGVLREGEIIDANPSFLEMFGYTREELVGRNICELYANPDKRKDFQKAIEKEGFVKDYEIEFRKKDGTPLHCLLTSSVQFADDGGIYAYRGIVRDVTERERTADALKESEKRYRLLFELATDAIYILTMEGEDRGRIISANREAGRLHGYTVPELLKMNILDLEVGVSEETMEDRTRRLYRGEALREVTTHRRKDGTTFPVEINARLINFGDRLYVLAVDRDVTQREGAQKVLRESEQRLRLINDSSPVGIRIVQEGKYVYVNPSFVRMFGYETPEQIIGLPISALYAPESRELILKRHTDRVLGKAVSPHYEAVGMTRGGKRFDLEIWGTDIEYLGRRSSLSFVMDVSEAKSLRSQLLQSQKMEAVGTLAGGIAHDFNNLLTVILGYSDLIISEKEEGDTDFEDLKKIIHAARTAVDMVKQILAFSRKTETQPRPINLNRQVEQVRKMLFRLIPKTIVLEMNLDPSLPTVYADPAQIDQVLMNLAVNARDAMPEGGKLLIETKKMPVNDKDFRFHVESSDGPCALLTVSDTGTGMDSATVERIFEPFFTTKKPGQGTGLGLATVYGIVKSHGGHIICDSEPGKGTVFNICLPTHQFQGESEVITSAEISKSGEGTILVVDDEEFVRQLAQRVLEKAGYVVVTAVNGAAAVETYREMRDGIALILLDLIMPVMDGNRCLEEILKIDSSAKVLIASGQYADEAAKHALAKGAKGIVGKPYNLKDLLETVRKVMSEDLT